MKKYLYIMVWAILLSVVNTACSDDDDDNPYATISTLKIVRSNVLFDAPASEGCIEVESNSPINAECNSSWCSVKVEGNTIKVSTTQNTSLNGRSTVLTITNGKNGKIQATVQQQGMRFKVSCNEVISGSDQGFTQTYDVNYNIEPTISTSATWLHVKKENQKLTVSADANTEGHLREGYIRMNVGEYKDSICVKQFDFDKDIAGDYSLVYTDNETMERSFVNVKLSLSGSTYRLNLTDVKLALPVSFDNETGNISLKAGQYIGIKSQKYLYTALLDSKADASTGTVTLNPSASISGGFNYGKTADNGEKPCTYLTFKDNGSWQGRRIDAILLYTFTKKDPITDNAVGAAMVMIDPVLIKK